MEHGVADRCQGTSCVNPGPCMWLGYIHILPVCQSQHSAGATPCAQVACHPSCGSMTWILCSSGQYCTESPCPAVSCPLAPKSLLTAGPDASSCERWQHDLLPAQPPAADLQLLKLKLLNVDAGQLRCREGQNVIIRPDCVLILDKYPKFRLHALVIARDLSLGTPSDLTAAHLPLLQHMEVICPCACPAAAPLPLSDYAAEAPRHVCPCGSAPAWLFSVLCAHSLSSRQRLPAAQSMSCDARSRVCWL